MSQNHKIRRILVALDASKGSLAAMVTLRARLQVDVGVLRQLSEDVPKVAAALDVALGFALEKVDEIAKRRDKGEDVGLPERIAITILENVQDAFGNLKKDAEKILNDAKKTPKHYRDEFRRLNDNLTAACAEFEEAAGQAAALHTSNLAVATSYGNEQGTTRGLVSVSHRQVTTWAKKIVVHPAVTAHNGSNVVGQHALAVAQTTIIIK
jgi:hypothetical protein